MNEESSTYEALLPSLPHEYCISYLSPISMLLVIFPMSLVKDPGGQVRLVIREIILQDFKSYGGLRVIGPFHECFSAIIGPNGSGKSNVIDALMFVFGKKAKKIRLSKLSELIHNPQKGASRPPFARVEVIFEEIRDFGEGSSREVVENSQLVVAREVSQNNSSKYVINGRSSNWTEVTQLFSAKGIDLEHNRFLILQGEVEQIAMMKPIGDGQHEEGLLEYLEDLIGSNQFIESITAKTAEFNDFSEQRNDHIQRVRQAEKEKDQLEGPRQEAEMYVKAASDMLETKCLLTMIQKYKIDLSIDEIRSEITESAKRLDTINEQIETVAIEAKELESAISEKSAAKAKLDPLMKERSEVFNQLDTKDTEMSTKIANTAKAIEKESKSIEHETLIVEKLKVDLTEIDRSVIPALEADLKRCEEIHEVESDKLEALFESVHADTFALKTQKEKFEFDAAELRSAISKIDSQKSEFVAQRQVLLDKQKTAEDMIAKSEKSIAALIKDLETHTRDLAEAEKCKSSISEKLEYILREIATKNRLYESLIVQVTSAQQKLQTAQSNYESLSSSSGGRMGFVATMHARIAKEVEKGKLKGVVGRLGDLCEIDPKYDSALAVALTHHVESLVVERTEHAQAVVEFCRSNSIGRVTCIILEIQKPFSGNSSAPLPRMVDLIKVANEEKILPAFWHALQETLLADDIETASRVGLGGERRYRVVTMEGQIVEQTGAMTGGGTQFRPTKKNNKAAIDSAEREMNLCQAELDKLQLNFENTRNERNALASERDAAERTLSEISQTLADNPGIIERLTEQVQVERDALSHLSVPKLTSEEQRQVGVFSQQASRLDDQMEPLHKQLISVDSEVKKLTDRIMSVASEKTKRQQKIKDEAGDMLDQKRNEVAASHVNRNKILSSIGKSEKSITDSKNELEELRANHVRLSQERVEIEEQAAGVLNEFNELKQMTSSLEAESAELEKSHASIKGKVIELRKKNTEILNEIVLTESKKHELESKSKDFGKQIASLRKEYKALPHELVAEANGDDAMEVDSTTNPLINDLTAEQIESFSPPEIQANCVRLEAKMTKLSPNIKAIEEYRQKLREYKSKVNEMETVSAKREEIRRALEFLRTERLSMFMAGYNVIALKVKEMYQMLTLGGDAELELVDTTDPFSKGISFSVRPPRKTWKVITQLSGGEKTLSSLALVFALHYFKPTPLYFLDEIDAALDTRNVAIIANYIKQRATYAQFIIISLRNHMFEIADWLVGIYKTDHVSKSVTLDPAAASAGLAAFKPHQERPFYAIDDASPERVPLGTQN
jgi:structural maintenance of chromosome 4